MSAGLAASGSVQNTLEELRALLRDKNISRLFEGGTPTKIEEGAYFPDQENPGKWIVEVLAGGRIETFRDASRGLELQSEEESYRRGPPLAEKREPLRIPARDGDCWSHARDPQMSVGDRVGALQECLLADNPRAVDLIVDELHRDDVPDEWRSAIVFAAENVHFKEPEQRARIRSRLRELALQLRESTRVGAEHVVWSAMRRFSSLMPPEGVNDLIEFLDRKGVVDTRMVALQCVARLFHTAPPSDPAALQPLAGRVAEYAEKFLDQDVFAGGENSSIARNAVVALAALGSPRLDGCMERVNALGRRWLPGQLRRQLRELLDRWRKHDPASERSPAFEVVERALKAVQTAETG